VYHHHPPSPPPPRDIGPSVIYVITALQATGGRRHAGMQARGLAGRPVWSAIKLATCQPAGTPDLSLLPLSSNFDVKQNTHRKY